MKKNGVSQAEWDQLNLEAKFKGQRSITKEELIEVIELSRVRLVETRYDYAFSKNGEREDALATRIADNKELIDRITSDLRLALSARPNAAQALLGNFQPFDRSNIQIADDIDE